MEPMATTKKQPPKTGLRNRKVQGFAALVVVAAVASGAVAWSLSGGDDKKTSATPDTTPAPKTPADRYTDDVLKDFGGMTTSLVSYLQTVQNWRQNKVEDAAMASQATSMLANIADTQHALATRAPFDQAPRAVLDYRLAADGYAQAAALAKATTAVPKGALRTQLQLAVMRVQTLADRVFDQGKAELKPYLTQEQDIPGVTIRKAPEVPNWAASTYKPGAPLADVGGDSSVREYQDTRPEQSFAAWKKLVKGADLPTGTQEANAISNGTRSALRTQAVDFNKTSDLLYGKPDPKGDRLINTRLQLAFLLDAEATQLGQAAALAPAANKDSLLTAAKALAVMGDKLWDSRLGERTTGFPESLLTDLPTAAPSPTATP
jgi:hypothetical protein